MTEKTSPFASIAEAIEEIRAGRMIVLVDDEDRENEGDLTLAAEKITPEAINFMAKFGRGLICLAMTEERLEHLNIGPMTAENTSQYGTAFCEAIDARQGVTTGISAHDRCRTIQVCANPKSAPNDLVRDKGHMDGLVAYMKSSPPLPVVPEVLVPGEIEFRTERERMRDGVTVDDVTWNALLQHADRLHVEIAEHQFL